MEGAAFFSPAQRACQRSFPLARAGTGKGLRCGDGETCSERRGAWVVCFFVLCGFGCGCVEGWVCEERCSGIFCASALGSSGADFCEKSVEGEFPALVKSVLVAERASFLSFRERS